MRTRAVQVVAISAFGFVVWALCQRFEWWQAVGLIWVLLNAVLLIFLLGIPGGPVLRNRQQRDD